MQCVDVCQLAWFHAQSMHVHMHWDDQTVCTQASTPSHCMWNTLCVYDLPLRRRPTVLFDKIWGKPKNTRTIPDAAVRQSKDVSNADDDIGDGHMQSLVETINGNYPCAWTIVMYRKNHFHFPHSFILQLILHQKVRHFAHAPMASEIWTKTHTHTWH